MIGRVRGRWVLTLIYLSCWHGLVSSFAPQSRRFSDCRICARSRSSPLTATLYDFDEKQIKETQSTVPSDESVTEQEKIIRMTFIGTKSVLTAPVQLPQGGAMELNDFFSVAKHRNLLFFRNDVSVLTNPSEDLIRRWSQEVALHGGSDIFDGVVDNNSKTILRMKAYLNMPGLRVLSENLVGANLILGRQGQGDSLPEYQFTVIDTKLTPEGAAPLVWLFNKLTKYMDKTSSFSRVRAVNAGGRESGKIVFTTDARLETKIRLPAAAAKVLPLNIPKFEQQGSRSMQKLLEKELQPALLCFRDAFVKWSSI